MNNQNHQQPEEYLRDYLSTDLGAIAHQALIDKINKEQQESNINRIKLQTLTNYYRNLCRHIHDVQKIWDKPGHIADSFEECQDSLCISNNEVLIKLHL